MPVKWEGLQKTIYTQQCRASNNDFMVEEWHLLIALVFYLNNILQIEKDHKGFNKMPLMAS